ncbi:BLUF domain-containing protein [Flammeovirga sp. SR4]|uniref:BLUF domain-containing protein n=2 Tax=Flammeovirgaceae TaxID=200667 RepID=A0A7X8XV04_9BACT|nr:BLUF domain-containing protein [Flammeovirga agarivorans]
MSNTELSEILTSSRLNNKDKKVTGILLLLNNTFIQVLEGEKEVVESLYNTISQDTRHEMVQLIYEGEIKERNFANWSMGFQTVTWDDLEKVGFEKNFEKNITVGEYFRYKQHQILDILKQFNGLGNLSLNIPE